MWEGSTWERCAASSRYLYLSMSYPDPIPLQCCPSSYRRPQSWARGMNREGAPGKSPEEMYIQQKVRVLLMLRKMGSNVSVECQGIGPQGGYLLP